MQRTIAIVILFIVALVLELARRIRLVSHRTLEAWSQIASIIAVLAAVCLFVWPTDNTQPLSTPVLATPSDTATSQRLPTIQPPTRAPTAPPPTPQFYFRDEFDGSVLSDKWLTSGPPAQIQNGALRLEGSGREYPFIYTAHNPFPTDGGFMMEVRCRYTTVGIWGVGFAAATDVPRRGEDVNLQHRLLGVWQDATTFFRIYSHGLALYSTDKPDTSWHVIGLEHDGGRYAILVDNVPTFSPLAATDKPTILWFGNTAIPGGDGTWPIVEVDYVRVRLASRF
jgi:hypothetical protein